MNSNNNGCHQAGCGCQQCGNGKFNRTDTFRAIDVSCIPEPPKEETVAYGSFYNPTGDSVTVTPITPPDFGQKVIFTTPGPSINVDPAPVPNNTTDLQVATSGVYEISMDISVSLTVSSNFNPTMAVQFGLFINDSILAIGSIFESEHSIAITQGNQAVILNVINTVGRTIQLRLNKDDRLSIRVFRVNENVNDNIRYRFASLVVIKIAD
ncbi:hypothetical protein [Lysinibacillus xylanilyticus]|uniref:hypothetical protein n=1 Tax=Lysinibacillus xylanilyticus TaxID=582475 RepID=UPI003CFFB0C1